MNEYKKNSLAMKGAVALGIGVMIVARIFALLGQVTALSGTWFLYIFIVIVSAIGIALVFACEKWFLHRKQNKYME